MERKLLIKNSGHDFTPSAHCVICTFVFFKTKSRPSSFPPLPPSLLCRIAKLLMSHEFMPEEEKRRTYRKQEERKEKRDMRKFYFPFDAMKIQISVLKTANRLQKEEGRRGFVWQAVGERNLVRSNLIFRRKN